jgi:dihydroorotate dehydrogenase (NAD+) catalytic subunit
MSAPVDTSVTLAGLRLKNPVLTASGCFGYGTEYAGLCDVTALGGLCTKGLSLKPRPGNAPPRIRETAAGMLNAIGLENVGIDAFVAEKAPLLEGVDTAVVANLFGVKIDEYAELCRRSEACGRIDAVELNISCPNVKAGGVEFGTDPAMAAKVTAAARAATRKPLLVKLSPNAGDRIVEVAKAVQDAGADGLTLINTISGMDIDVATRRPVLANRTGGLSGPAIKPLALRMVNLVSRAVAVPVVGIGGIATWTDAVQFLLAGAVAVQVGTVCFSDPGAPVTIAEGIARYCAETGVGRVADLVGALEG